MQQLVNATDYYIYNCTDLQNMDNDRNSTAIYYLMNNINCNDTITWNSGKGFKGMGGGYGNVPDFWQATFEGNGYTISNLYMTNGSDGRYMSIFADTGTSAIIRNVGIINVTVIQEGTGYAAVLAASGRAKIENVFISNSNVSSNGGYVGIFTGFNVATINNTYSERNKVKADGQINLGGISGNANAGIFNSWSNTTQNGISAGGIAGQLYSSSGIWNTISFGQSNGSQSGVYLGYQNGYAAGNNSWLNTTGYPGVGNCVYGGVCPTNDTNFSDITIYYNTKTQFPLNNWNFNTIWKETPNSMPRLYFEFPQITLITLNNSHIKSGYINFTVNSTAYNISNCSYSVNSGSYTNNSCNNISIDSLSNGNHTIDISVINSKGYITNKTIYFNKDNRTILLEYLGINITNATTNIPFYLTFNITCKNSFCGQTNLTLYEKSYLNNESNTSFESANDVTEDYTDVSNAFSYTTTTPYQGTYAIFTEGVRTNVLFQKIQGIDVSKYSSCTISAWMKGTSQLDTGDGICIDYSMNNGTTWNTATAFSTTLCITQGNDNNVYQWKQYTFTPTSTTIFKWRFRARTGDTSEDVWADNVVFNCSYVGGALNNTKFQMNYSNPLNFSLNQDESKTINITITPLAVINSEIYATTLLQNNSLVTNTSNYISISVPFCHMFKDYGIFIPRGCVYKINKGEVISL